MEQPVTFKSGRETVVGMLHLPRGRRKVPGVVMLHGFTGNRVEAHRIFVKQARALCQGGVAVLRFDFRGSGDSGGEFSQMTLSREAADARKALAFMRSQDRVDEERVGVLGLSMGGLVGAMVLTGDPALKASVLWSPVAHPSLFLRRLDEPGLHEVLRKQGFLDHHGWAVGRVFFEDAARLDILGRIHRIQPPVLLVHGSEDAVVPPSHSDDYEAALRRAGKQVHRHVVEGADHTFSSLRWEAEVLGMTYSWFKEFL